MKKKLESELLSIAHRILKLSGKEDVIKMHAEVATLYEKLAVLKFAYENFEDDKPTITTSSVIEKLEDSKVQNVDNVQIEVEKVVVTETLVEDSNHELIEEIVESLPKKEEDVKIILEDILPKPHYQKNDLEDLMAGFAEMPIFDPVPKPSTNISTEKKSLNDTIKKGGFNMGLNDKLAVIKHLFEGKNEDYERVMSQLNSFESFTDAKQFLIEIVKPDYNNWLTKEDIEERFLQILESKFN